jgi:hypothetical protein
MINYVIEYILKIYFTWKNIKFLFLFNFLWFLYINIKKLKNILIYFQIKNIKI